jgi:hypothetical protein
VAITSYAVLLIFGNDSGSAGIDPLSAGLWVGTNRWDGAAFKNPLDFGGWHPYRATESHVTEAPTRNPGAHRVG